MEYTVRITNDYAITYSVCPQQLRFSGVYVSKIRITIR